MLGRRASGRKAVRDQLIFPAPSPMIARWEDGDDSR